MSTITQAKPIHGAPKPRNVPSDMQDTPPIPCAFKVGDRVLFTNPQGVPFEGHTVRGFTSEVQSWGGFIYLDLDCWWFPVNVEELTLTPDAPRGWRAERDFPTL